MMSDGRMPYQEITNRIEAAVRQHTLFSVYQLGEMEHSDGEPYSLMRVKRSPHIEARPTVAIVAGFHGEEPAGPNAVAEGIGEIFEVAETSNLNLLVYSCANPWGYERNKRNDPNDTPTNWWMHDPPAIAPASKLIMDDLEKHRVEYYLDLHEDDVNKGAYLFLFGHRDAGKPILGAMSGHVPIENTPVMDDPSIKNADIREGVIFNAHDGSSEDWMYHRGATLAVCTETPHAAGIPLVERVKAQRAAIYAFLEIAAGKQGRQVASRK